MRHDHQHRPASSGLGEALASTGPERTPVREDRSAAKTKPKPEIAEAPLRSPGPLLSTQKIAKPKPEIAEAPLRSLGPLFSTHPNSPQTRDRRGAYPVARPLFSPKPSSSGREDRARARARARAR